MKYETYDEKQKFFNECYDNGKKQVEIWACGFRLNNSKEGLLNSKKPVKGIVFLDKTSYSPNYCYASFQEYKKNSKECRKGSVDWSARLFADTEEECIELYNKSLNDEIEDLQSLIDKYREMMI